MKERKMLRSQGLLAHVDYRGTSHGVRDQPDAADTATDAPLPMRRILPWIQQTLPPTQLMHHDGYCYRRAATPWTTPDQNQA